MPQSLPTRPSVEQLKKQAKELLEQFNSGDPAAVQRVQASATRKGPGASAKLRLSEVQHVIAREYGFANWSKLKHHVETIALSYAPMEALVKAVLSNDVTRARTVLSQHPALRSRLNEAIPEVGFGGTLLLAAVQRSNREMIDLLVQSGADINARSDWWAGSFGVLDTDRGPELASFLIDRGAKLDAHSASRLGLLDKLKEIVHGNPEAVHAKGGDGQTPLHFASTVKVAEFLLEHGARIDALDVDHESTPAQYMVKDRADVARYLVGRGCRADILMAAALGDENLVRKHLQSDPGCIRMCVSEEYFPKRNIHAGGTIYIWTLGHHKTPHQVARQFGHEHVFRLLMEHTPPELQLVQACELGDEPLFRQLLAKEPHLVRSLQKQDQRRVANAAQNNNTEAVRLMLEAGWPVDACGQHQATPLHWAAFHGNVEMARVILRHSPPLESRDADFAGTPLGWAIHGSEHGWYQKTGHYAETVETLMEAGANRPAKIAGTELVKTVLKRWSFEN